MTKAVNNVNHWQGLVEELESTDVSPLISGSWGWARMALRLEHDAVCLQMISGYWMIEQVCCTYEWVDAVQRLLPY